MPRIQGLTEFTFSNADTLVKSVNGYLFSITLTWTGATAGDKFVIRDGLDAASAVLVPFVVAAAAGTITREWSNGKAFATGLFLDQQGGGAFQGEITYK